MEKDKMDVILEHVVKLHQEMTEFRTETNDKFIQIDERLERVEGSLVRIENDHGDKLKALFDWRTTVDENLITIDKKIDKINSKLDAHDVILKRVK